MALLKNLGTVLSQIKFTRHSTVAPWFVRWWGFSVTGLKGLWCWRLRARDQNLKWPSSLHLFFIVVKDIHRCTYFEQEDTAVQLLFTHSQLHSAQLLWGIMEPHASRPAALENKLSSQSPNQEWHEWSTDSSCNGNNVVLHCAQLPANSTKQNGNIPAPLWMTIL